MSNKPEIKWRGSTYVLNSVQDGKVYWVNTTSGFHSSCSIESWEEGDPYDGRYS